MCRVGITNTFADTLSRRDQNLTVVEALKRAIRFQQMIPNDKIDGKILEEIRKNTVDIASMDCFEDTSYVEISPVDVFDHEAREQGTLDLGSPVESELGEDHLVLAREATDSNSVVMYDIDGYNIIDKVIAVPLY